MDNIIKTMGDFQQILEKFQKLGEYIAHLEQGVLDGSIRQQRTELVNTVLFEILVNKGIITTEEAQSLLEEKVNKPIQEYVRQIQQAIQANAPQIKQEIEEQVASITEEAVAPPDYGETPECEGDLSTSNVILSQWTF